jgi:hypothetical protein
MPVAKRNARDGYWPAGPEDLLSDVVREAIDRWQGNLPATLAEFRLIVAAIACEALEEAGSAAAGRAALSRRERETIARLVSEFIDAKNPRLVAQCYDFTFGLGLQMGITETQIAAENGVGKAAVSRRCREIVKNFDIPPARGMKSEKAVGVYQRRAARKHASRRATHKPWAFAGSFAAGLLGAPLPEAS